VLGVASAFVISGVVLAVVSRSEAFRDAVKEKV
jgi:hypothetical protein